MGKRSVQQGAAMHNRGSGKRQKQEGITQHPHRNAQTQRPVHVQNPESEASESEVAVDKEDLAFVRRLGAPAAAFLSAMNAAEDCKWGQLPPKLALQQQQNQWQQDHDSDPEEAAFRHQIRSRLAEQDLGADVVQRLPIKGLDGSLKYESNLPAYTCIPKSVTQVSGVTVEEGQGEEKGVADSGAGEQADTQRVDDQLGTMWKDATGSQSPSDKHQPASESAATSDESHLQDFQNKEERREELKQQMALACKQLLQAPENHLRNLRGLLALTVDEDIEIVRMALLSLMAVFKDILPGYCIRLPTQKEQAMPVSKDVMRTRDFEGGLLRLYQAFIKQLMAAVVGVESGNARSSQLSQVVVPTMTHRDKRIASSACSAVRQVLTNDQQGNIMLEVVQLVADLVKRHNCDCDSEVLCTTAILVIMLYCVVMYHQSRWHCA